jgi:hypothetical protein
MARQLNLEVLPGELAVAALDPAAEVPAWALAGEIFSLSRSPGELSVVCAPELIPRDLPAQRGLRAIAVEGPLEFDVTGILDAIAHPLAAAEISIFAISTYTTDYVLVAETALGRACTVLRAAGHMLKGVD